MNADKIAKEFILYAEKLGIESGKVALSRALLVAIEALEDIREDLDGMPCSGPCDSYGVCRICTARSATLALAKIRGEEK